MLGMTLAAGGQEAALFRSQVRLRRFCDFGRVGSERQLSDPKTDMSAQYKYRPEGWPQPQPRMRWISEFVVQNLGPPRALLLTRPAS
jgi:hypothetical protein